MAGPLLNLTGAVALASALAFTACAKTETPGAARPARLDFGYRLDESLRLNQVQMRGTHNSYHQRPASPLPEWDYQHETLTNQL